MSEDPLGDIKLKEADSTNQQLLNAMPALGNGAKAFKAIAGANDDGDVTSADLRGIAAESTGFVQSCMDIAGAVSDPLGWLVGNGLNFLLAVCQPLQDAIHFVSGDGPALANAAESFGNIGQGLQDFGQQFGEQATTSLAEWEGTASETAGTKFGEFAKGIAGAAGEAGNIAQLLQISSMIMTVIEDFIKALLTELITWLITLWIPALAAAVPSLGASTAAAGAATGVRAGMTATRATRQVSKLQKLLDLVQELLAKLKTVFGRLQGKIREGLANKATERMNDGLLTSLRNAAVGEAQAQVGFKPTPTGNQVTPGKPAATYDNAGKANDYGDIGEEQSHSETSSQLDF